jgi:hypothetical protein
MTKRRKKRGIRRCQSCGEVIRIDGEWLSNNSKLCMTCKFIGGNDSDCYERQLDVDINDIMFYSDLDEYDYEMIGDPNFDIEEYLQ